MSNKSNLTEEYKQDIANILKNVSDGLAEKVEQNLTNIIDKLTDEVRSSDSINKLSKEIEQLKLNNERLNLEISNHLKENQIQEKYNNLNKSILNLKVDLENLNYIDRVKSIEEKISFQNYILYTIVILIVLMFVLVLIS